MKKQIISSLVAVAMIASTASAAFAEKIDVDNSFSMQAETEVELSAAKGTYYEDLGLWFDAETGTITDCDEGVVSVDIPEQIDGMDVTGIGDYAFAWCTYLETVTIPNSVTSIGDYAFYYCRKLTSVTIPDSVTSIGESAFYRCINLTSMTIPNGITSIRDYTFYDCESLENITIPDNITSIGNNAFEGCQFLTTITIPAGVTSIGDCAFIHCAHLTSINVDGGNPNYSSLDGNLFNKDKTTLIQYALSKEDTYYSIPDSVTTIVGYAFSLCYNLTSITIPDSVTDIGAGAFLYCGELTSIDVDSANPSYCSVDGNLFNKEKTTLVQYLEGKTDTHYTIPDSVTSIGEHAFDGCDYLTSVTIPNSVTSIGDWAFSLCFELSSITIPNSVTSIGIRAFENCESLTSITIPDGVTSIGNGTFLSCINLGNITIPNSVTSIDDSAFRDCESLGIVYYVGTRFDWGQISIGDSNRELIIAKTYYLGDESDILIHVITQNKLEQKVSANFRNNTDEPLTFEAICAVYDEEGALITYAKETVTLVSSEVGRVTFNMDASDWASCKLFAWDELGAMRPLSQI